MIRSLKSATWKVFGASMLAGQLAAPALMGVQVRPPFTPELLGTLVFAGLVGGVWIFFGAWTWRRLPAGATATGASSV